MLQYFGVLEKNLKNKRISTSETCKKCKFYVFNILLCSNIRNRKCVLSVNCRISAMCNSRSCNTPVSPLWRWGPTRAVAPPFTRFLDHTTTHHSRYRTPLDEWSARHIDLYLKAHNTHNRQTSMPRQDSNPHFSKPAAADLRLRPRGHWDRPCTPVRQPYICPWCYIIHSLSDYVDWYKVPHDNPTTFY